MITCNHILGENEIKPEKNKHIFYRNEKKHFKTIKIGNKRKIYTVWELNEKLIDITIIEIKDEDGLDDQKFLET